MCAHHLILSLLNVPSHILEINPKCFLTKCLFLSIFNLLCIGEVI